MIQIFVTGGTFDKSYDHIQEALYFEKTHLPQMLERSRCQLDIQIDTLMMIDSLDMNTTHVETIISACMTSKSERIVITHGTDRMVETAKILAEEKGLESKTIILTGAMIPYAFGSSSDGFFNLGCALAWVQVLKPQIYIGMQGKCFDWNKVYKDQEKGIFKAIL